MQAAASTSAAEECRLDRLPHDGCRPLDTCWTRSPKAAQIQDESVTPRLRMRRFTEQCARRDGDRRSVAQADGADAAALQAREECKDRAKQGSDASLCPQPMVDWFERYLS